MKKYGFVLLIIVMSLNCSNDDSNSGYSPTAQPLDIPEIFSSLIIAPIIPNNNPQTVEGVALGKRLFFDPILLLVDPE